MGVRHGGLNLQTQHWEAEAGGAQIQDQPGLRSKIWSPIKIGLPVYTETLATYLFERTGQGLRLSEQHGSLQLEKGRADHKAFLEQII